MFKLWVFNIFEVLAFETDDLSKGIRWGNGSERKENENEEAGREGGRWLSSPDFGSICCFFDMRSVLQLFSGVN